MLLVSLAITVLCMLRVLLLLLLLLLLSAGEVGGDAWQQDPCKQHRAHGL
jgi:hypothetical protein